MPTSSFGQSINSRSSSDGYRSSSPPSSNDSHTSPSSRTSTSTDHGSSSSSPPTPVLTLEEIHSLKLYSCSLKHLTYQLFKNLHPELNTDGMNMKGNLRLANITESNLERTQGDYTTPPQVSFHSCALEIQNMETESNLSLYKNKNAPNPIRRSVKSYPRRQRRSGPPFPDYTGL